MAHWCYCSCWNWWCQLQGDYGFLIIGNSSRFFSSNQKKAATFVNNKCCCSLMLISTDINFCNKKLSITQEAVVCLKNILREPKKKQKFKIQPNWPLKTFCNRDGNIWWLAFFYCRSPCTTFSFCPIEY